MNAINGRTYQDAVNLSESLGARGWVAYRDFEILNVSLADSVLEVDPYGAPDQLLPALDQFCAESDFVVLPYDESQGYFVLTRA